jgi:hypothetical protein
MSGNVGVIGDGIPKSPLTVAAPSNVTSKRMTFRADSANP